MRRTSLWVLLAILATPAYGQLPRPRSIDYLTVAGIDDVRAAWVNPAGLARILEASIMAEVVVDRLPETGLVQYTLGMNSRGFSFSFARDRTLATAPVNMTRFGVGFPFPRGALGIGVTLFRASARDEGIDLGFQYRLARTLDVGAVLRYLGQPTIRGDQAAVTGLVGARWRTLAGLVTLDGEVSGADTSAALSGILRYRGLLRLAAPGRSRIEILTGVEATADGLDRLVVGIGVGPPGWIGGVGGASRSSGLRHLDRVSLTGMMSHRGTGLSR